MMKKLLILAVLLPITLGLAACSDPNQKRIEALTSIIERNISTLENQIRSKELRNIKILDQYVQKARQIKPEHRELIDILAVDATSENPNFKQFKERFQKVGGLKSKEEKVAELTSLSNATDPQIYNEMLVDTINVIADLTDGQLPKLESSGRGSEAGPGAHLVGNPAYGQWQSRNGQSFWVWYGAYRMFGDLWGRPYYYHSWYYNRPWSYYHDYGRGIYGGRSINRQYDSLRQSNDRQIKQYGQRTGRNPSSYAKRTNSRFTPSNATTRAQSSAFSASHRSGSRSGGRFGGK